MYYKQCIPYALYIVRGNSWINGQIQVANGTASLPQYSLRADTNKASFNSGADQIGISTGGVQRMTRGNSNANCKLHVNVSGTTASSNTSTSALVVSGGMVIDGNSNVDRNAVVNGSPIGTSFTSEYLIGETTSAQFIYNLSMIELTLNGLTASGNVGGCGFHNNGNIKVPSTGV
jgi:hypothetical protein